MTLEGPPNMQHAAEVVSSVMHRHGISARELATNTGYSEGHISRILSGNYPLGIDVFRWLYSRTGDRELMEIATGEITEMPAEAVDESRMRYEALLSVQRLAHELASSMSDTKDNGRRDIDEMNAIADARAHLTRLEAARVARQRSGHRLEMTG